MKVTEEWFGKHSGDVLWCGQKWIEFLLIDFGLSTDYNQLNWGKAEDDNESFVFNNRV